MNYDTDCAATAFDLMMIAGLGAIVGWLARMAWCLIRDAHEEETHTPTMKDDTGLARKVLDK